MSKPSLVGQLDEYSVVVFTWNDDFFMHVHVSSSESMICLQAKCTFTCHHIGN